MNVAATTAGSPAPRRLFATPLARRLARMRGFELVEIPGSGPNGRIVKSDVEAFEPSPAALPATAAANENEPARAAPAAVFHLSHDCELDALLALSAQLRSATDRQQPELVDFVAKAAALAIGSVPEIRKAAGADATEADEVVILLASGEVNETPVALRGAERASVGALAQARTAAAAASDGDKGGVGHLIVHDMSEAGIDTLWPAIRPPAALALSIGSPRRAFPAGGEQPGPATIVKLTLAVDGAAVGTGAAARLMAAIARLLQNPLTIVA